MSENDRNEMEKIMKTLQYYGEAFQEANIEKLVTAFNPESKVYWYVPERGGLVTGRPYGWIRGFCKRHKEGTTTKYHTFYEEIDQKGTVAYARFKFVVEEKEGVRDITDYLTLMKFSENWEVVNKSGYYEHIKKEDLEDVLNGKSILPHNVTEEVIMIEKVLQIYADAFHEYDIKKIRKTFHPQMRVNSVNRGTYEFKNQYRPLAVWQEILDEHKKANIKFETEIEKIDQTGTAAVARMKWIAYTPKGTFETTDYLTLLKIDNQWLIVNKSCNTEKID